MKGQGCEDWTQIFVSKYITPNVCFIPINNLKKDNILVYILFEYVGAKYCVCMVRVIYIRMHVNRYMSMFTCVPVCLFV